MATKKSPQKKLTIAPNLEANQRESTVHSREFYEAIINTIGDSIFVKDEQHRWVLLNDECCRSMGYPREFLISKTDTDLFDPKEAKVFWEMDEEVLRTGRVNLNTEEYTSGKGEKVVITTKKTLYESADGKKFIVGVSRDVTAQKKMEKKLQKTLEQMEEISLTDDLTKLYNRRGFISLAEAQLRLADRHGTPICLVFVDLNNMKEINDRYGHQEGDEALKTSAKIMQQSFRRSDIVGRLGGDEFVVLAIAAANESLPILRVHLQNKVEDYNKQSGKPYRLSMSIGICGYTPGGESNIYQLLQQADKAMYEEKVRIKGLRQ